MSGSRKMVLGFVAAASMVVGPLLVAAPASAATDYANCTELRADYPHGVGEPGAVDSTSSTPVTNFTVDQALYDANSESDRDGDGIACEKH
ncbi:excalibur calcium-binding domain-containing protein [Gordonia westfalica]|uniref:Excalibur calcium-binding domain-containing protein n=1 Tax=Gordonia westfalica TaxID=158898 RepID=A0ABU2GZK7_9ACTN|nr:excalibur calcium-binding domain-containing protein [Gordonia westfalica]MDS1116340.1 excalibur calcium-binding domain-containing protein [Gordonia westfalica]